MSADTVTSAPASAAAAAVADTGAASQAVLRLANVESAYGPIRAIRGVSLKVAQGEIATVLGSNGAGKTTILKTISGIIDPRRGSIEFKGENIAARDPALIVQQGLSHVPEGREVFPTLTVHQNLLLGCQPGRPHPPASGPGSLEEMYRRFPALRERQHTPAGVLSGGEQQMLSLCRALMGLPRLLLVDEPTEGLAPGMAGQVAQCLQDLRAGGVGVLLIEQKLGLALTLGAGAHARGSRPHLRRLPHRGRAGVTRGTLREDAYALQRRLAGKALRGGDSRDAAACVAAWVKANERYAGNILRTVQEMRNSGASDFPTLSVALQAVRRLQEVYEDVVEFAANPDKYTQTSYRFVDFGIRKEVGRRVWLSARREQINRQAYM